MGETKIVVDIKFAVKELQRLLDEAASMQIETDIRVTNIGIIGERYPRRLLEVTFVKRLVD